MRRDNYDELEEEFREPKNGVCRMEDFRGIPLVSVAYKTMYSIVQQRLVQVVEQRQLLAEEQGGLKKRV